MISWHRNCFTRQCNAFIHSFQIFLQLLLMSTTTQRYSQLQHWYCVKVNMLRCYRQLRVKDLPKVPTWFEPTGHKAPSLPLSLHAPYIQIGLLHLWWDKLLNIRSSWLWDRAACICEYALQWLLAMLSYVILSCMHEVWLLSCNPELYCVLHSVVK